MTVLSLSHFSAENNGNALYHDVCLHLEFPAIVHLKGINGAGKSTFLRHVAQLRSSDGASSSWRGKPLNASKEVAYLGHDLGLLPYWTVADTLRFYQRCHDWSNAHLEQVRHNWQLDGMMHAHIHQLSRGLQQKLALARFSYCAQPLWLLDEPGTALDTTGIHQLVTKLHRHRASGGVVIFSAHHVYPDLEVDQTLVLSDFHGTKSFDAVRW